MQPAVFLHSETQHRLFKGPLLTPMSSLSPNVIKHDVPQQHSLLDGAPERREDRVCYVVRIGHILRMAAGQKLWPGVSGEAHVCVVEGGAWEPWWVLGACACLPGRPSSLPPCNTRSLPAARSPTGEACKFHAAQRCSAAQGLAVHMP